MNFRYVKRVTDPTKFDELYTELLILELAKKLVGSLAGTDPKLMQDIQIDIKLLMPGVKAIDRQETNTRGKADRNLWNDARFFNGGRIDSQLGS